MSDFIPWDWITGLVGAKWPFLAAAVYIVAQLTKVQRKQVAETWRQVNEARRTARTRAADYLEAARADGKISGNEASEAFSILVSAYAVGYLRFAVEFGIPLLPTSWVDTAVSFLILKLRPKAKA